MRMLLQLLGRLVFLVLLFLLLFQSCILFSVLCFGGVPIAFFLERIANSYLAENGYYFELDTAFIDLKGDVVLTDARFYEATSGGEILSLDRLYVESTFDKSNYGFDLLKVAEMDVYLPSLYSPSGLREHIIHLNYLDLSVLADRFLIDSCRLKAVDLDIQIEGEYAPRKKRSSGNLFEWVHYEILERKDLFANLLVYFSNVEGGRLLLETQVDSNGENSGDLLLSCDKFRFKDSFSAEEIYARFYHFSLDRFDRKGLIDVAASNLSYKDNSLASFYLKNQDENHLYAGVTDIETAYERLDAFYLNLDFLSEVELEGCVSWLGELNSGRGDFFFEDYRKGLGAIHLVANSQNMQLLSDYLTRFKVDLEIKEEVFAFAEVFLSEGWNFDRVLFSADSGSFSVNGLSGSRAHASGIVHRDYVHVENAFGFGDRFDVSGQYYQHYKKGDFFIKVQGEALPYDLDGILKSWWVNIWKDFNLYDQRVGADVFVGGRWGDRALLTSFSEAHFSKASYRNVDLIDGEVSVFQRSGEVHVKGLDATLHDGFVKGDLHWYFSPEGKLLTYADLYAKVQFTEIIKLSDKRTVSVLDDLVFDEAPLLSVDAVYSSEGESNDYLIESYFKSEGESSLLGLSTKDIACKISSKPGHVSILNLSGYFIAGDVSGDILLNTDDKQVDIDLEINSCSFEQFADYLKGLSSSKEELELAEEVEDKEPLKGMVNLDFDVNGPYESLFDLKGTGRVEVSETDFGSIHLLWGISKLFDSVGLGFTSFAMDGIHSDLRMKNKTLFFDNMEILGPKIRIKGDGSMALEDQSLDFDFNVFLMEAEKLGLTKVLGFLLKPLGYALPIKLRGYVDQPQWRLGF